MKCLTFLLALVNGCISFTAVRECLAGVLDVAQSELMGTIQETNRRIANFKMVTARLDFLFDGLEA